MELHPENAAPWDVELGQFGRAILAETDWLTAAIVPGTPPAVQFTPFGLLYLRAASVRERLGGPSQPAVQQQGSALERMIERRDPGGLGQIYIFCGGLEGGQTLTTSRLTFEFPEMWQAGQPAGGGPGPSLGLYEPSQGFGQLWRTTPAVRDCLGYATAADATAYTVTAQVFNLGRLLTLPDGQTAYVVWGEGAPGGGLAGHYERIGLPTR